MQELGLVRIGIALLICFEAHVTVYVNVHARKVRGNVDVLVPVVVYRKDRRDSAFPLYYPSGQPQASRQLSFSLTKRYFDVIAETRAIVVDGVFESSDAECIEQRQVRVGHPGRYRLVHPYRVDIPYSFRLHCFLHC